MNRAQIKREVVWLNWREHGAAAIEQLRQENIVAYVKIAVSLVPKEVMLQVSRPVAELSDDELQQAAQAEREQATLLIEHIKLKGGEHLIEEARRELVCDEEDDA